MQKILYNSKPEISAVIVNYKTLDFTNKAIESIISNCKKISKEIIVIDNASNEGSSKTLNELWGDQIKLISNNVNIGFGRANNQGFKQAKGKYLFLLNSDAEIIDDSLEKMVRYCNQNPNIGILGCKIISDSGEQQVSCWKSYNLSYLMCRAFNIYKIVPEGWLSLTNVNKYGKPESSRSVEVVSGCCMLVNRQIAEDVGYFDERFFMYCEDTDWCTRMRKAGHDVYFLSEAVVKHYGGCSSDSLYSQMTIELSKSTLKLIMKNGGFIQAYLANILLGLFFLLRLPVWFLVFLVKGRNAVGKKFSSYLKACWWHIRWPFFVRLDDSRN